MSNLFKNLSTQGLEQSEDRLGGFQALDTNIYIAEIKALYAGESKGGAISLNLVGALPDGREYRETLWITNKNKQNFYLTKDKKKAPLPGFVIANDLCLIATGRELHELETEEKVVRVWDPDIKGEVNKAVPMITAALGQKVALGIMKTIEDKTKKNESTGDYEPTGETREVNSIDKVFHPELKLTVAEARKGLTEPAFWDAWLKRNEGQTRDKSTANKGGRTPGTPPKAGGSGPATSAPRKSLFGK